MGVHIERLYGSVKFAVSEFESSVHSIPISLEVFRAGFGTAVDNMRVRGFAAFERSWIELRSSRANFLVV